MNTPDEMIACIQAHKYGKKLQYLDTKHSEWYDIHGKPAFNFSDCAYRIKPEPKQPTLRKWKPEEVPVGALIRGSCYGVRVILGFGYVNGTGPCVLYIGGQGNVTGDGLAECLRVREHSIDYGKTWHPCGVLE